MSLYLSEDEQLTLIRDWFKKYGKLLTLSLGVFLSVFMATQAWQNHKKTQNENASILYERLLVNLQDHKKINYPERQNTAYGHLATMLHAREAVNEGDLDTAVNDLKWVISHTKNSGLKQISRIRLARTLLAQNKPELALKQIKIIDNKTFNPLINDVKANILRALGEAEFPPHPNPLPPPPPIN